MEKCLTIILDKFDSKTKKRQSDLHFVFQETAASFSSLFCFSFFNSRRISAPTYQASVPENIID